LVSPATTTTETVAAKYESRSFQKMVTAATTEVVEVPAQYSTRTYRKLAQNASATNSTTDAKYATRTYQKLVTNATSEPTTGDAQYTTVTMQKLVSDATTNAVYGGPQYTTRSYQRLVSDASAENVTGEPRYASYSYQKLVSDASSESLPCSGQSTTLNVNFESGSAILTGNSSGEISRVAAMMTSDATMSGRIVGHTDSQGNDASNLTLSRNRAKAVYDALVAAGVDASRLSYEGRGESSPIADNNTADGRRENRRVELVSSGKGGNGDCKSYKTRTYQRLVNDASATNTSGDAQYTTRTYQKLITPATTTSNAVAAKYETRSYQKLTSSATASENTSSAEYTTRSYQKLASAATTTATPVEAKYETRTYSKTTNPTVEKVDVAPQYKTITRRQLVKAGGFTEWKEVVCQADVTPDLYRRIQQALIDRGYDVGAAGADGKIGTATKEALVKFQKDNGLPVGSLDVETLRALGVQ
jgi:outer membrane protein OmpA-like peptidoglycan-associated protein